MRAGENPAWERSCGVVLLSPKNVCAIMRVVYSAVSPAASTPPAQKTQLLVSYAVSRMASLL